MLNIDGYGRIASDIPIKRSKDGKHLYTNFLLASHDSKKNTTFIRCVAFDAMSTLLHDLFSKGDRIIIRGDLISDDYHSKKNIYAFEIKVTNFEFVETLVEHKKNKDKHFVKEVTKDGQRDSKSVRRNKRANE